MLILSRKPGEKIVINNNIVVTVLESPKGHTRIGIDAPKDISVHREEIQERIMSDRLINALEGNMDMRNNGVELSRYEDKHGI